MIEWLEIKTNFNLLVGAATTAMKTGTVAGSKLTKKSAYVDLAAFVNQKCGVKWDWRNAEARVRGYIKRFRTTKRAQLNPGGAKYNISPEELAKGIDTIEKKLEADCPFFARMDILFGGRQNIAPAYTLTAGMRPTAHIEAQAAAVMDDSSEEECEECEECEDISSVMGATEDETDDRAIDCGEAAVALASLATSPINSSISTKATPKPQTKKAKPVAKEVDNSLKKQCAETVATTSTAVELSVKLAEIKNQNTGKKRDFSSVYAETKGKEIDLEREKFYYEKENRVEERKVILSELLRQKLPAQQIKEYIEVLL
jgi:hypothetical protein